MDELIGKAFGPYKVLDKIGEGGMAVVYKGFQESLNRYVAIKVLRAELSQDSEFISRFRQEALAVARLAHPNILHVYDAGTAHGVYYLVMDYVDGGSLRDLIELGPVNTEQALSIAAQLADALDYAHREGLIHRDIKPSNILLTRDGRPLITDFGIAKAVHASTRLTRTGTSIGTPEYMAPEQVQGQAVDERTDIYALGIVLYEMLTGQVPFSAHTPVATLYRQVNEPPPPLRQMNISIPAWLDSVVARALAKRPEERFRRAGEMAQALKARQVVEEAEPLEEPTIPRARTPRGTPTPTERTQKRNPVPILLGAIGVLVVGLVIVIVVALSGNGTGDGGATPVAGVATTPAAEATEPAPSSTASPAEETATPDSMETEIARRMTATAAAQPSDTPTPAPSDTPALAPDTPTLAPTATPRPTEPPAATATPKPPPPPQASLDKYRVVFGDFAGGDQTDENKYSVWMMRGDGSQAGQILNRAFEPGFAANGQKVALYRTFEGIWVYDRGSQGAVSIIIGPYAEFPSFSPDGSRLVFHEYVGNWQSTDVNLYIVNADGSGRVQLPQGIRPDWSPKGDLIAFDSCRGTGCGIFVIGPDGQGMRQITSDGGGKVAWAPDGRRLAYSVDVGGDPEIFVVNVDGSGRRQITNNSGNDSMPAWSPDGQYIYFLSDQNGTAWAIVAIKADGSGLRSIRPVGVPPRWQFSRLSVTWW
jgi:Tol biopolymer transport system component/predicted Ser/Thr protein kinase